MGDAVNEATCAESDSVPMSPTPLPFSTLAADDAALHSRIDELEQAIIAAPDLLIDLPLVHRFVPGMYIREIYMPAGSLVTSKIHKTEHPFAIMSGRVSVLVPGVGVGHLAAPYLGITKPGTRRVLLMHEDTIWVTFHANPDNETDLDVIEDRLIERRELADGQTAYEKYRAAMMGPELFEAITSSAGVAGDGS